MIQAVDEPLMETSAAFLDAAPPRAPPQKRIARA